MSHRRRSHLKGTGLLLGLGALLGAFFASQSYLIDTYLWKQPVGWGRALLGSLLFWSVWTLLAPAVVALARRFPIERPTWRIGLPLHLAAGGAAAFLHVAMYAFAGTASRGEWSTEIFSLKLWFAFVIDFHWDVLIYWAVVSATLAHDFQVRLRERELRASELQALLTRAELDALRMQLHPHFLFNALNTISSLMYTDVDAADRMTARLSDFLRLALRSGASQEVSLEQELEFATRYLEIEETRFADRLTVGVEADPEVLGARVPALLLQPLVENAVRHGLSARPGPGRVEIRAARDDGSLRVSVADDGPGLPAGRSPTDGIGLANTRARLERLYGAEHRFELRNRRGGGAEAVIEIPFR